MTGSEPSNRRQSRPYFCESGAKPIENSSHSARFLPPPVRPPQERFPILLQPLVYDSLLPSTIPNPRVQHGQKDVGKQVAKDDQRRHHQQRTAGKIDVL